MYLKIQTLPDLSMSAKNLPAIRRKLLRWYDKARRDLPWRRTTDPYAIWIAETMLQQTQVATVSPYYERFLHKLPTVHALHRASIGTVLALWSGLGYYRRALNLKKSAREIVRKHAGQVPDNYDALTGLPGIGDYTAGALMSIAFQKPYPAIDGNAHRVLRRLFDAKNETELRQAARLLVPRARPGYFNQGLMELGATVCIRKEPRCPCCPVAFHCSARANGKSTATSSPANSPLNRNIDWPLAIVRKRGKILLRRRERRGILAGLWELPGGETKRNETVRSSLGRQLVELNRTFRPGRRIGEFRHSITNLKIHSPIFLFDLPEQIELRLPSRQWRWLSPSSLSRLPLSSMTIKAANLLANHEKNSS
jgi:A/G-specific adenine glycosylase